MKTIRVKMSSEGDGEEYITVAASEILDAWRDGGLDAVNERIQANADDHDVPYYRTEPVTMDDLRGIVDVGVWEINDGGCRDWCVASSREEAVRVWRETYSYWNEPEPEVDQLGDKALDIMRVYEEGEPKESAITFREELAATTYPRIFCSTER